MESKHPVDADHSAIVKFESDSCQEFSQTLSCLKECFAASRHAVLESMGHSNAGM